MKVWFVIQKLAGISGGAERILVETANAMASRGMNVTVITFERRAGPPAYPLRGVALRNLFPFPAAATTEARGGHGLEARIKAVPNVWPLPAAKFALTHGAFINRLRHALRRHRPDVVVGVMPPGILAAADAAAPLGLPVIASTHNLPEEDFGNGARWDSNPIYRARCRAALAKVRRVLVLQEAFRAWFGPAIATRVMVMPNPLPQPTAPLSPDRPPRIIAVGRLTDVKRVDLAIAAFAKVAPRHPDWRFDVFGTGPEHDRLAAQIAATGLSDRIRLQGTTDQIMGEYARSALMCHPARFEGFGLAVGEALAHGVPVIADADCPGVNALVRQGENGVLVHTAPDPVAAFAEALDQLMGDDALRRSLAAVAPTSVADYAPSAIYDRWENVLRSCLSDDDLV